MNYPLPQGLLQKLVLADGSRWDIAAGDKKAAVIVSRLAKTMQLCAIGTSIERTQSTSATPKTAKSEPLDHGIARRFLVRVESRDPEGSATVSHTPMPFDNNAFVDCALPSIDHGNGLYFQLMTLSSILACDAQGRGAVLLHGALAEKDGIGVLLAAPGGTGKTTASNRLAAPWRSRCDDATLVVRDARGSFWAHPWPTWSRFLEAGSAGNRSETSWDVQSAVPLKGIFFLSQALEDRAESVGPGHGVSLLVECAKQASQLMTRGLSKENARPLHLERFDNLCSLARAVPAHVLRISLTGAFWQEIERTLEGR